MMKTPRISSVLAALCLALCAPIAPHALASTRTDITIGMQLEPPHLDPTSAAAGAIDQVLYANVFEGLTRFAEDGSIIPALAKSWRISGGGRVYDFTLQEGVRFHDGTMLDAHDVKFSLDRARGAGSTNAQKALFANIASVEVITPHDVRITLLRPSGQMLFNLAWGDAVIIAPESVGAIRTMPIGTGPFRLQHWHKGERITLIRNPDYWGEAVRLERATFRFIADPNAAFAAMMAGDIDAFPNFPAPEVIPLFEADKRFKIIAGTTEGETILAMNNAAAPLADKRVRQAIAHALDRQAIIDGALYGYGTPIGTHFAPHHPDYLDLTAASTYDVEAARRLLKEAGYGAGFTTTLKLPPPSYARRSGEIIQAQLHAIGIRAEIITLEWAQWLEEVFRGHDYGLTIISHTEPFDIGIYARPDYYFGYENPELAATMRALDAATERPERRRLTHEAQRIISADYVNGFLFQLPQVSVLDARIEGMWEDAPTQATDLTEVYWKP